MKNTTDLKSFNYLEDGSVNFSVLETKYTKPNLEVGVYDLHSIRTNNGLEVVLKTSSDTENFNTDISFYFEDKIEKIYNSFFNAEIKTKVNSLGYNHKLGLLLYGRHGTGKSSMLKKYFTDVVRNMDGIVFNITEYGFFSNTWNFIKDIRKIQNNPIVVFMDEFEELVDPVGAYADEGTVKKIMDGFNSIDNVLFLMATNYIDKVPKTIKNRPSRVKYCIEVKGIEDLDKITKFLSDSFDKIGMKDVMKDIDIVKLKNSTLDELKQVVLDRIMEINESIKEETKKIGY